MTDNNRPLERAVNEEQRKPEADEGIAGGKASFNLKLEHSPDQQLHQARCSLNDGQAHRVHIKFEEDAWDAFPMLEDACVVRYRILVGIHRS